MAFIATDLFPTSVGNSVDTRTTSWRYKTNDAPVTVYAAGYFAAAGSTTGTGQLTEHDTIEVTFDLDGIPVTKTMVVSNAAAGTAIFKDIHTRTFGPYAAVDVDTTGNIVAAFSLGGPAIIVGFELETTVAITTTPISMTYNLEIDGTDVTGGVITITAAKTLGSITAGSAITGANVAASGVTIDLECVGTTAATEGSVKFIIKYA